MCNNNQAIKITFVQSASAHVQAKVGLGPKDFTPLQELVSAKLVSLCAQPGKFRPGPKLEQSIIGL
jgi:hypothetical protein